MVQSCASWLWGTTSMARKPRKDTAKRDDAIKEQIKQVLGMSVPKYISVVYGRSQKAAQIMFNQPDKRLDRDEALLAEIHSVCKNPDGLAAHFIAHILGSNPAVLNNIQTTIDSRFQSQEAENTVVSLSRPMLSDQPAIRQIEMINDRYFYQAIDMQNAWLEAKKKQERSKSPVHIPHTMEQIKNAFQVVIDMCLLIIDLKAAENTAPAREALARAYALASAAAIQIGRYDIVEQHAAQWRERFELHNDPAIPLRVRNLLLQKELWIYKRKADFAGGLAIAETQWAACEGQTPRPRWMDIEPLVCAGLELAALQLKQLKDENEDPAPARAQVAAWLARFEKAPERAEELGAYLQEDPELEPVRLESDQPPFRDKWRKLMKKFGVLAMLFIGLAVGLSLLTAAASAAPSADLAQTALDGADLVAPAVDMAGANPGKLILDLINLLLGLGADSGFLG